MNYCHKFFAAVLLGCLTCPCLAQVQADDAWIQLAPPAATVNAAYVQIHNPQARPQTIVDVTADCCAMAMLHHTRTHGDKVSMDHLDALVIPAQSSVQLAPGGLHIMLMKAKTPLAVGNEVKITFSFDDGYTQAINFKVKKNEF